MTGETLGWEGEKRVFQANRPRQQAKVTILISDKADVKPKSIRRDKGHVILINWMIYQKDISVLNISTWMSPIP